MPFNKCSNMKILAAAILIHTQFEVVAGVRSSCNIISQGELVFRFLVQMRTVDFAFEINWPLEMKWIDSGKGMTLKNKSEDMNAISENTKSLFFLSFFQVRELRAFFWWVFHPLPLLLLNTLKKADCTSRDTTKVNASTFHGMFHLSKIIYILG